MHAADHYYHIRIQVLMLACYKGCCTDSAMASVSAAHPYANEHRHQGRPHQQGRSHSRSRY